MEQWHNATLQFSKVISFWNKKDKLMWLDNRLIMEQEGEVHRITADILCISNNIRENCQQNVIYLPKNKCDKDD